MDFAGITEPRAELRNPSSLIRDSTAPCIKFSMRNINISFLKCLDQNIVMTNTVIYIVEVNMLTDEFVNPPMARLVAEDTSMTACEVLS